MCVPHCIVFVGGYEVLFVFYNRGGGAGVLLVAMFVVLSCFYCQLVLTESLHGQYYPMGRALFEYR